MARDNVAPRVLVALRLGNATAIEVARLVSIPQESARRCLSRLTKDGSVHIVERRKRPVFRGMPTGAPMNVYGLVKPA